MTNDCVFWFNEVNPCISHKWKMICFGQRAQQACQCSWSGCERDAFIVQARLPQVAAGLKLFDLQIVSFSPLESGLQLIDCLILSSIIANLFFHLQKSILKSNLSKSGITIKRLLYTSFTHMHILCSPIAQIAILINRVTLYLVCRMESVQLNQLFVIPMNNTQLTKNRIPPTPNLQEIKQKNKSKSKRKPNSIQPTNPPTPKIHKAHITLKSTHDKHFESREQHLSCQQHPDRQATYVGSYPNKWRYCNTCYLLRNDDEQHEHLIIEEKKSELESFKRKIMDFGLKLEEAGNYTQRQIGLKEQNFKKQLNYISSSFMKIREDLDQKERQLTTNLVAAQQLIMQSLISNQNDIEEMKKALERYINEINNNYEDIVDSLPFEKFMEIIRQYHDKIKYFEEKVEGFIFETTLNAYIPKKEMEKLIDKANVQSYSQVIEQTYMQTRTLQRYTTQKQNFYMEGRSPSYNNHQQGPMGYNKINQHRQSRDRDLYLNNRILINKQNLNYDNYL